MRGYVPNRFIPMLLSLTAIFVQMIPPDRVFDKHARAFSGAEQYSLRGSPYTTAGPIAGASAAVAGQARPGSEPAPPRYGKLPLGFEANQGQVDSEVRYFARGANSALFLTAQEAVLTLSASIDRPSLPRPATANRLARLATPAPQRPGGAAPPDRSTIRMKLLDANPCPSIDGVDELPGKTNYITGSDPKKWRTEIPTYGSVRYRNEYPGIDLIYHGNQRQQLEYDFVVAPGFDPGVIGIEMKGASELHLDGEGNLKMALDGAEVTQDTPFAYQDIDGVRKPVSCNYLIGQSGKVGFIIGDYDGDKTLVIDPILAYSTYLGGEALNYCSAAAVDSLGSLYVTGATQAVLFPTTPGAFQTYRGTGIFDVFVAKLNADGSALEYSTFLGGSGDGDEGFGIQVDAAGDAYVTGIITSNDFPTTSNAFQPSYGGGPSDAFVAELDTTGSRLLFSSYLGGNNDDDAVGIAVDTSGGIYLTGLTASRDFPATPGAFQNLFQFAGPVAFVCKIDSKSGNLVYSTSLTSSSGNFGIAIAVDANGNVYITGNGFGDFPVTPGAFQTEDNSDGGSAIVSKLDPTGSTLIFSTYLGGSGMQTGNGIAVDSSGNVYVCGSTSSRDFPVTRGAFQVKYGGGPYDGFVTKLDPTGSSLIYSTYLGGRNVDEAFSLGLDQDRNAYVTGPTTSKNFPTANAVQDTLPSKDAAFVTKLNPEGSGLVYSTFMGGSGSEGVVYDKGIAVDNQGSAYAVGPTTSTDFPVTANAFQRKNVGATEGYIFKLSGPIIDSASIVGKKLEITGENFVEGDVIVIDGKKVTTTTSSAHPTTIVVAPNGAKKIVSGETVTLRVENPDGELSVGFPFQSP
jgi:hypothetical protein